MDGSGSDLSWYDSGIRRRRRCRTCRFSFRPLNRLGFVINQFWLVDRDVLYGGVVTFGSLNGNNTGAIHYSHWLNRGAGDSASAKIFSHSCISKRVIVMGLLTPYSTRLLVGYKGSMLLAS